MVDVDMLKRAHRHSIYNRDELARSAICGCFDCLAMFDAADITEWTDNNGTTAFCPKCANDTVLGSASGFPMDREFFSAMKQYWCADEDEEDSA